MTPEEAEATMAVAAAHQSAQAAISAAQMAAVIEAFRQLDPAHPIKSWIDGIGARVFGLISVGQQAVSSQAMDYVTKAVAAQGFDIDLPQIRPENFAGIASDGTDLDMLLAGAPIRTSEHLNSGDSVANSMRSGEAFLRLIGSTQISDAARAADSVAISTGVATPTIQNRRTLTPEEIHNSPRNVRARETAAARTAARQAVATPATRGSSGPATKPIKAVTMGYVRMLNPPSCGRCVILAGKWYRWNTGFLRHPMCDCRHIPAPEANASDLTVNPMAYFNSLSKADQDAYFGKANSAAIRDGGDMGRIINATASGSTFTADDGRRYTRTGASRRRKRGSVPVLRPTVWQIYRDARGDKAEALRALKQYGYVLG